MNSVIQYLRYNFRALAPARVYALLTAIGTFTIGLGYLIASESTVKGTILYQQLDQFNLVKPFGLMMVVTAILLFISSIRNSRRGVALWAFCNVLIWIFIGALFINAAPGSWFTALALVPVNLLLGLYTRYLASRPLNAGDNQFDEHVDATRHPVVNWEHRAAVSKGAETVS